MRSVTLILVFFSIESYQSVRSSSSRYSEALDPAILTQNHLDLMEYGQKTYNSSLLKKLIAIKSQSELEGFVILRKTDDLAIKSSLRFYPALLGDLLLESAYFYGDVEIHGYAVAGIWHLLRYKFELVEGDKSPSGYVLKELFRCYKEKC
ncbi:Protein CBG26176 [Caenorhabditis briggsae]|uniref:Uncharacterized protein n=2 Tax=Caenorhabditis briggsae TaxID=6238 RepID=A0AAE9DMH5_CAEBR|nr:Protein CBG26176 [Caenorhabditis briggsae]ULU07858.1 hypothetical protein L3Y34_019113 [Caenorhabditis briggsae]CAS00692.1 Protein CBG26176 [Caenorhabditis briggsae]